MIKNRDLILELSDIINENRETVKDIYYKLKGKIDEQTSTDIFSPTHNEELKDLGLNILVDMIDEFQEKNELLLSDFQLRLENEIVDEDNEE